MRHEGICTEKIQTTHMASKDQIKIIFSYFCTSELKQKNTEKGEKGRN